MRKQVFCIKWGNAYSPNYVNILYAMVARNITGEFSVICFTDDSHGIRKEVECFPLPPLGCEIPSDVPGKWRKQALWSRNLFGLEGVALFLDLDVVIVDNIDGYFDSGRPDDVFVARNCRPWVGRHAQTSIFRYRIGAHAYMHDQLLTDPVRISRKYRWEQDYVTATIRGGGKFWPDAWTKHFRDDCVGMVPLRYVRAPRLPRSAKIVIFPGLPNPPDAIIGQWPPAVGRRTLGEHFRWAWQQDGGLRKLRDNLSRFSLPAPWVGEHWRE